MEHGWDPKAPHECTLPPGLQGPDGHNTWEVDAVRLTGNPSVDITDDLLHDIDRSIQAKHWLQASDHYGVSGMELGIDN
eukprot:2313800-Pyramimonas_sp.AAC.1